MANTIEVPDELILPTPKDDRERDLFNALQDAHRQITIALIKINSLLP